MKKLIAVILTLCCALGLSASLAATKTEITFNNIPWGSSPATAKQSFSQYKVSFSQRSEQYWAPNMKNYMEYFYGATFNKRGSIGCVVEIDQEKYKTNHLEVGGYVVDDMKMYFVKKVDSSGKLSSNNDGRLFFAYYHYSTQSGKQVYTTLKKKLTDLYGTPSMDDTLLDVSQAYWEGKNDTIVLLDLNNNLFADDEIYLKYGYMKADKWLKEAEEAYNTDPKAGDSVEGL